MGALHKLLRGHRRRKTTSRCAQSSAHGDRKRISPAFQWRRLGSGSHGKEKSTKIVCLRRNKIADWLDIRLLGKSTTRTIRRLKLFDSMTEQILPIGIDSTLDHVQSEADRVDALFTGPIGFQQVNYHTINEDRQRYSLNAQNADNGSPSSELNEERAINDVKVNRLPARFSLPEIDSSSEREKSSSTLSVRSALRFASKEAVLVSE
jgi:hypothetical protein